MGSKVFLLLGLLMAIALLISSEVAARELAETSTDLNQNEEAKGTNGFDDAKDNGGYYRGYPGGGGGYGGYPGGGGGYGGYPGGGGGYGGYPGGHGGYPGGRGGGYCRYGCCGGSYYGRGCRCCSYAEAVRANIEVQPQN